MNDLIADGRRMDWLNQKYMQHESKRKMFGESMTMMFHGLKDSTPDNLRDAVDVAMNRRKAAKP